MLKDCSYPSIGNTIYMIIIVFKGLIPQNTFYFKKKVYIVKFANADNSKSNMFKSKLLPIANGNIGINQNLHSNNEKYINFSLKIVIKTKSKNIQKML